MIVVPTQAVAIARLVEAVSEGRVKEETLRLARTPEGALPALAVAVPSFRSFNSQFAALLRDGETMQYTSATDPVTGEVMKIDVTLAVMK